jgi:hypothetical protein
MQRVSRPSAIVPGLRRSIGVFVFAFAGPLLGGFPSTEVFLPAVGRVSGQGGAEFYTTVWATNLTGAPETFTFRFLKQGQANGNPASFSDTLAPGETKVYENVVQTKLGLSSTLGAARITSTGEILMAERIYDQAPGADLGDTEGLFFAGVPKAFSIAPGQSASIQGVDQGGAESFRYNFALVETGGGSPTVNVQLFDGSGALLGQKAYALQPYEQLQPNVAEVFAGIATTNSRLTATVTGGTGSVLLAGAQLANVSQDSSGFEMSFRDDLLGGGSAGVTSLNGLTGALTLKSGNGISVTPSGTSIIVAYTGGGSTGLTSVTHDETLTGDGTGGSPLGISVPVVASGSSLAGSVFGVNSGTGPGVQGQASHGDGVAGSSIGAGNGVRGAAYSTGAGIYGTATGADGVFGQTSANLFSGVYGTTNTTGYGVFGEGDGTNVGAAVGGNAAHGGLAGHFYAGNVRIENDLHVIGKITAGTKDFKIDHPLDPAGKYLVHASIESSEMLNIYSGNVQLDARGEAAVRLPSWMEAENADFRYQLTAIGGPARDLFIASEISNGEFKIAGGTAGMKVSWQVTGVRKDRWAIANPLVVEEPKPDAERGFYLHPELYGAPPEKQTNWADEPEQMKRLAARSTGSGDVP